MKKDDFRKYYNLGKELGKGGYGTIYECIKTQTNEKKAIKLMDFNLIKNDLQTQKPIIPNDKDLEPYINGFENEVKNMMILQGENKNNKNTVLIDEYFQNENEFAIIMELCDDNLTNFFSSKEKNFNPKEIYELLIQLNNSFKIMAINGIVHRAINLTNILIKYENKEKIKYIFKLKITDDSCSLEDSSNNINSELNFNNNRFLAPEILKGENHSEVSDLWSIGILIYILSFREPPFKGSTKEEILKNINNYELNNLKKTEDSNLNDLIKGLLNEDPKKRITWKDYFNHIFFKNNLIVENKGDGDNEEDNNNENDYKEDNHDEYEKIYEIKELIGEGGFAKVYRAINKKTNEERAIKIIDKEIIRNEYRIEHLTEINDEEMKKIIDDLINEIKSMKMVNGKEDINKNTVKLYDYFDSKNKFAIVMELCDNNLTNQLAEKKSSYNIHEIYEILSQLNNTFRIMAKNKLSHRDIKLENILIKNENQKKVFKLTDYGVSKQLVNFSNKFSTKVGTTAFMAPEVLEGKKYNNKCDLWSLGVTIYVLIFKEYPYKGDNQVALLKEIKRKGQRNLKKIGDPDLDDLIRKLLVADPEKRISWEDYFNHSFFKNKK